MTFDPDSFGEYEAHLLVCHACAAREDAERALESPPAGAVFSTTRR